MHYDDHFRVADDLIRHLDSVLVGLNDPYIESKYTGFLSISAAAVLESALKVIFAEFAESKHKVFGHFVGEYFHRINGRISVKDIRDDYLKKCGDKYLRRFNRKIAMVEAERLASTGVSVLSSYGNLLAWRHEFAHQSTVPANASYGEVKAGYESGKEVMRCLAQCMRR